MKKAIYPGSFDPPTKGHLDLIERASRLCDELVVGVLINENKQGLFTLEERVAQLENATRHLANVRVLCFCGYLTDLLHRENTNVVIRGLRDEAEVEYEKALAGAYRAMDPDVEVVYLMASPGLEHFSSTLVREGLQQGTDVSALVPEANIQLLENQWGNKNGQRER